jgi:hypothetical protein
MLMTDDSRIWCALRIYPFVEPDLGLCLQGEHTRLVRIPDGTCERSGCRDDRRRAYEALKSRAGSYVCFQPWQYESRRFEPHGLYSFTITARVTKNYEEASCTEKGR